MLKSFGAWLAIASIPVTTVVVAGPPFATDDPEPTDYQHYELFLAFEQTRTREGTEGALPLLELNYGAAPDLQLSIAVPLSFNRPAGGASQHGLGDITLGAKYRFVQEADHRPMVAFYPSVNLASGDAGKSLGAGATQIYLPLWLQKSWGAWQTYGGAGYLIDHGVGARNRWFLGWQLQREITERLTLGGELFLNTQGAAGEGSSLGFNLGGLYHFTEHHHLVFSAGRGLTNASRSNQFSSYCGYQLTW